MSGSRVAKHTVQRAGAIRRTPRFHQAVAEHLDNAASSPDQPYHNFTPARTLRRKPVPRRNASLRQAAATAQETGRIDEPPPSINNQRHQRVVEEVDRAGYERPELSIFPSKSLADEREIQKRIGLAPLSPVDMPSHLANDIGVDVPPLFRQHICDLYSHGHITMNVARYYLEVVPRGDSTRIPNQKRDGKLLQTLLSQDASTLGSGWQPVRRLGSGGFGTVVLWQRIRSDGKVRHIISLLSQLG